MTIGRLQKYLSTQGLEKEQEGLVGRDLDLEQGSLHLTSSYTNTDRPCHHCEEHTQPIHAQEP